jgi:predicted peroxiredoxin
MKTICTSAVAAIAMIAAAVVPAQADSPNRLLTILTAPEPQTQLMAMVLTMNAMAAGAKAEMLLCGPAGDIALKDAPETATAGQPPKGASPQGLMKMMMEKNGLKVQVCAIYLPGKAADASALLEGVTAAKPNDMGAAIVTPGTTVMSF